MVHGFHYEFFRILFALFFGFCFSFLTFTWSGQRLEEFWFTLLGTEILPYVNKVKKKTRRERTNCISDKQKLSIWGRQSTFAGSPSVLLATRRNNRARSETRSATSYGFGSGIDRFAVIQSQPTSPMQERPVSWYVRDIDIGDGAGSKIVGPESSSNRPEPDMFGHRPMRRRSRHDCHFMTGSHVPIGKGSCFIVLKSQVVVLFLWKFCFLIFSLNFCWTGPLVVVVVALFCLNKKVTQFLLSHRSAASFRTFFL